MSVPISAVSALTALSGDVYVLYRGGQQANAEVHGEIRKAASGEVAQLYAQQFPYKQAPARVGSVILQPAGTTASYQFQVTPALATRYQVELFQSSTASAPVAVSAIATIYVITERTALNAQTLQPPGLPRIAAGNYFRTAFGATDRDVQALVDVLRPQPGAGQRAPRAAGMAAAWRRESARHSTSSHFSGRIQPNCHVLVPYRQ